LQSLVAAVRNLQPGPRQVFVLRELEGLGTEACGAELGLSEPTVKLRLHRARLSLRAALEN
jgi:RNA polymerase sigma-70 factor (ECF subfamily)